MLPSGEFRLGGRSMKQTILVFLVFLALGFAASGPARADVRLCNETGDLVYAAIGHIGSEGPVSTGWFGVEDGTCGTYLAGVAGPFYVYGEDDFFFYWEAADEEPGFSFCLDSSDFTLRNGDHMAGGQLACPDNDSARFMEVNEVRDGMAQFTFTGDNAKE